MKKSIYSIIPFLLSTVARAETSGEGGGLGIAIVVVVIIALIIAFIVLGSLKAQMKTAKRENMAMNYVRNGSFKLDVSQDIFLYQTEQRQRVQTNKN